MSEPIDVRDLAFAPARPLAASLAKRFWEGGGRFRQVLIALLVLELTVVSGIYAKRVYGPSQVIFVPIPASPQSLIT